MASQYHQTSQKEIQDQVRLKYKASIYKLKLLNFEELCFFSETAAALGFSNGPIGPLGVLAALPKEVIKIGRDFSANAFFALMISREYDTYVSPFGLGVKYYTSFTDGTCAITANFESPAINDEEEKLYKFAQPCSIEEAWKRHQTWVDRLTASGKQRKYHLSFDEFTKLAYREDRYMQKPKFLTSAIFRDSGSTIIATLIFISLLVAVSLIFLVLPSITHILYPACWFVRSLGKPSLPQSLLIALFCIATSWLLARIQKGMYIVDGAGTTLRGQTPLPEARGYISTKWLVFMFLPILPVRSYRIDGEYSNSPDKKYYSMQPLDQLHWAQIKATIWEFRWWYLLAVVLWIGVSLWSLSQCL